MKRLISVIASAVVWALLAPSLVAAAKPIAIHGPTIVAFSPPATATELKNPDTNEALTDFQFYGTKVGKPLRGAGIDFQEAYAPEFRVQRGMRPPRTLSK